MYQFVLELGVDCLVLTEGQTAVCVVQDAVRGQLYRHPPPIISVALY